MKVSDGVTRLVTAGLITGALAAPAESARPIAPDAPSTGEPVIVEAGPAPVVQRADEGFDWASAAIGAGAGGALVLLLGVGGTTSRNRHDHVGVAS